MKNFDVIVIGGGIIGKAVTLELLKNNINVACIHRNHRVYKQTSLAAGAMLCVLSEVSHKDAELKRINEVKEFVKARDLHDNWIYEIEDLFKLDVKFKKGLFVVGNTLGQEHDIKDIKTIIDVAKKINLKVEDVESSDIEGYKPHNQAFPTKSIFLPSDCSLDVRTLIYGIEKYILHHREASLINAEVLKIIDNKDHIEVVCKNGNSYLCKKVVLAGGAEINNLIFDSNIDINIPYVFAGRGVSLRAKSNINFPYSIRTPNRGFACGIHLVPNNDDEIYIGATNRFTTTPDMNRLSSMNELSSLLFGATNEINTSLNNSTIQEITTGYRPVAIDKIPLIGRTNNNKVLLATGTYRNGVLLAPLAGKLIKDEILGHGLPNNYFSPLRELELPFDSNKKEWVNTASKDLVQLIKDPNGFLPNEREEQIEVLFSMLLSSIFEDNKRVNELKPHIEKLMQRAPIRENIPTLIELLSRIYK